MTQQVAPLGAPLGDDQFDGSRMGLLDRLPELRMRMIWIVGALLIGTVVGLLFVSPVLKFIIADAFAATILTPIFIFLANALPLASAAAIFGMNSIFGIGVLEFAFILIFALIFMGPERLPKVTRYTVDFIRRLQTLSGELTRQVTGDGTVERVSNAEVQAEQPGSAGPSEPPALAVTATDEKTDGDSSEETQA